VSPFDEVEEAIERANTAPVGLAGYNFTRSSVRAVALQDALEVGMVGINSFAVLHTGAPFVGVRESGYGYEGGGEGLAGDLPHKYVHHA
jgi:succinate-semialdehyde dehydrogenase/glutarate-semialdehyde dehydrogenase